MIPFAGLLAALEEVPDPRRRQGRRYALPHLLLFSVLAVLAGATSYRGVRVFIAVHRERLNAVFGTTLRRAPAVNTMRALFQALAPRPSWRPCSAGMPESWAMRHRRPDPASWRSTARRSGAASTIWTTGPRRTCRAPSPARRP